MKITKRKTKTGATISIRATSKRDRNTLTDLVMSGKLMAALDGVPAAAEPADLRVRELPEARS